MTKWLAFYEQGIAPIVADILDSDVSLGIDGFFSNWGKLQQLEKESVA